MLILRGYLIRWQYRPLYSWGWQYSTPSLCFPSQSFLLLSFSLFLHLSSSPNPYSSLSCSQPPSLSNTIRLYPHPFLHRALTKDINYLHSAKSNGHFSETFKMFKTRCMHFGISLLTYIPKKPISVIDYIVHLNVSLWRNLIFFIHFCSYRELVFLIRSNILNIGKSLR